MKADFATDLVLFLGGQFDAEFSGQFTAEFTGQVRRNFH